MGCFHLVFVVLVAASASADDSCPSPGQLAPCTCDGEGVNCMGARTLQEIRAAFRAPFKYGGVRSVWIQGTPLSELPADLFGKVRAQQFHIEVNNISRVDSAAFAASRPTLHTLSLFGNQIRDFDFRGLSAFDRLAQLNLGKNRLESIPDGAFSNRNLAALILAQNRIASVGMNAFSGLPSLARLEMGGNALTTLGTMAFAFNSHSAALQINLSGNRISEVSASAFHGADPYALFFSYNQLKELKYDAFGNLITRIVQKGGFIEVSGNPFSCRGCDYSWLVLNKQALFSRLLGFQCTDGKALLDLTRTSIGC